MEDFQKALKFSLQLLKYRARSRNEVISRLKQKGYHPSLIGKVIGYLQENNYLNDRDFVREFVGSCRERGWGPLKIDFQLKKLGVAEHLRRQALSRDRHYGERMQAIIRRKAADYIRRDKAIVKNILGLKIARYLAGRGFTSEDIFRELDDFFAAGGKEF